MKEGVAHLEHCGLDGAFLGRRQPSPVHGGAVGRALVEDNERILRPAEEEVPHRGIAIGEHDRE